MKRQMAVVSQQKAGQKTVQGEGVGPLLIRRQGLLQGIPWSAVLLWICLLLNMYYLGLIKNKVDNRWNQPVAHNKARKALIEFTINRKGDVSNVRVADSSGDSYFDQTALRAVTLSTPFPPLPRGFKGDSLRVHYRFIFGEKS